MKGQLQQKKYSFKKKYKSFELVHPVSGKTKKVRTYPVKHKKTSVSRQICISCFKKVISKLDKNYEKKICKACEKLSDLPAAAYNGLGIRRSKTSSESKPKEMKT